jgi:predicted CopG family antitoxin
MSKNVMLSDEAYKALSKHKTKGESFSDVVLRLAAPQTCSPRIKFVHRSA